MKDCEFCGFAASLDLDQDFCNVCKQDVDQAILAACVQDGQYQIRLKNKEHFECRQIVSQKGPQKPTIIKLLDVALIVDVGGMQYRVERGFEFINIRLEDVLWSSISAIEKSEEHNGIKEEERIT